MAKRDMTAEQLLEHLYRGLRIEPDVQAEMNARDLRELEPGNDILQNEGCATPPTTGRPADDSVAAGTNPPPTTTAETNATPSEPQKVS